MARPKTHAPDDQSVPAKLSRLVDAKRRGRSNKEIAEAAGLTQTKLSQLIGGAIMHPQFETVAKLLRALPATLRDFDNA